jgi:hypothetical protein
VGTMDGKTWLVNKGKLYELTPELMRSLGIEDSKKK